MAKDGDLFLAAIKREDRENKLRKLLKYIAARNLPLYNPDDYGRIYN